MNSLRSLCRRSLTLPLSSEWEAKVGVSLTKWACYLNYYAYVVAMARIPHADRIDGDSEQRFHIVVMVVRFPIYR